MLNEVAGVSENVLLDGAISRSAYLKIILRRSSSFPVHWDVELARKALTRETFRNHPVKYIEAQRNILGK